MQINRLQSSEKPKTKNPIIFALIPMFIAMLLPNIIKTYDKGNHSDWAVTLIWIFTGISWVSLCIYLWKMIEAGKVSKKYVLTLLILTVLIVVIAGYVLYQTSKPF